MKSCLLCGIAIASVLMFQSVPASLKLSAIWRRATPMLVMVTRVSGMAAMRTATGRGMALGRKGAAAVATGAQSTERSPLRTKTITTPRTGGYYYPAQTYSGYSDPGYVYSDAAPAPYNNGGDSVAYCEQTYRSYDPASGSYLGDDGYRHACP